MEFYYRDLEIEALEKTYHQIDNAAKMVVLTGRRRVGKTLLALKHGENKPRLYLFVAKKAENLLCQEFIKQIKATFDFPVMGEFNTFKAIFALLLEIAKQQPFVLIIDEVQEFWHINPSVFSDIQMLWDKKNLRARYKCYFWGLSIPTCIKFLKTLKSLCLVEVTALFT